MLVMHEIKRVLTNIQHYMVCAYVCCYLVEAVHCSPPVAVSVQYFPAAVLKAHFLSSRLISS